MVSFSDFNKGLDGRIEEDLYVWRNTACFMDFVLGNLVS